LLRVSSILQDRVRTEGLLHLMDSRGTNNVAYMNLRAGLAIREIHWIDQHNNQVDDHVIPSTSSQDFGVDQRVQESLSKMRTDLDAFTEVEAYSLMLDGYRMSKNDLEKFKHHADCKHINRADNDRTTPTVPWKFQGIAPWINTPTPDYIKQLEIAQSTFGKALRCYPWLWVVLAAFLLAMIYIFQSKISALLCSSISVAAVAVIIVLAIIQWLVSAFTPKWARFLFQPPAKMGKAILMCAIGTFFIKFYQIFINPFYVAQGRLDKLSKPEPTGTDHN